MKKSNNTKVCYNGLMINRDVLKVSVSVSIFASLACLSSLSAFVLSSSYSHAEASGSVTASVTVPDVCTLSADSSSTAHTATVEVGTYTQGIGETLLNVLCNDNNGYSIYAVGYSNNTVGNTNLIGTTNGATIPTGTSTVTGSSAVSNWAMKLTAVSGTFPATILDSYDSYHVVPSTATKVATRTSSIDLSADSQIKTTYAVSISPSQAADTYTGKVKYTVVHPNNANADGCVETITGTMQGVGHASLYCDGASGVLTDSRDSKTYTVKKINGALWMTQNLRYLGDADSVTGTMTIGNNNSNTANTSILLYSLDSSNISNLNAYSGYCDSTNSYYNACVYDSGSDSTGVWYNYFAATAGTISGDSNENEATSDICPKNWHLPSYDTEHSPGSIGSVIGQTAAFSPSTGGYYGGGSLDGTSNGYWWSSAAGDATGRRFIGFGGSNLYSGSGLRRYSGYFIRCTHAT